MPFLRFTGKCIFIPTLQAGAVSGKKKKKRKKGMRQRAQLPRYPASFFPYLFKQRRKFPCVLDMLDRQPSQGGFYTQKRFPFFAQSTKRGF